jgi:hypothetical protein
MTSNQQSSDPAFWAGLFDFSFTRFITLKFIRVIYIILVAMIGLVGLLLFFVSLASGHGVGGVFVAFSVVPLVTLFWIILARLTLEGIVVIFRIGENTTRIAESIGATQARPPAAGSG